MKNNNEIDWALDNFIIIKKAFSILNSDIEKVNSKVMINSIN